MALKSSTSQKISKTKANFVEVIASPGSGKTYTLILRLQHLIANGVPAEQILVLSFSNTTVDELKRRIALPIAPAADKPSKLGCVDQPMHDLSKVTVCTAHSFANSLIKKRPVLTDKKAATLLSQAIRLLQRTCKRAHTPGVSAATKRRRFDQLEALSAADNISLVLNLLSVAQAANKTVSNRPLNFSPTPSAIGG